MQIEELISRLVETARQRVQRGSVTERRLARLCGVSQPHMHNVLKNIRSLSPESADRLMQALGITVPELLWRFPEEAESEVRAVPVVRQRIGPGSDANLAVFRGYVPLAGSLLANLVSPVAARLSSELVLPSQFRTNDLLLLDQNEELRNRPSGGRCWVVAEESGLRVRYVRLGGTSVYLANEATVRDPRAWDQVQLNGRNILEVVRARIVWIGRDVEAEEIRPAG